MLIARFLFAGILLAAPAQTATQAPAQPPTAQQPQRPQTFRSGTQVVEVDVRVFDKDGRFVTDLKPQDFAISEDRAPQPIVALTLVRGDSAAAPSLTASPAAEQPPRAIWLFVFDTLHIAPRGLNPAKKAVEDFLQNRFREGDIGGVIAEGRMANNRLTSNREELIAAVRNVSGSSEAISVLALLRRFPRLQDENEAFELERDRNDSSPAMERALYRACNEQPDACVHVNSRGGEVDTREAVRRELTAKAAQVVQSVRTSARMSLSVVAGLSNGLARMAGAKSVVLISDGFVTRDMQTELRQATGQASRAGVHIYSLDSRGLDRGGAGSGIINQEAAFDTFGASNSFDLREDGTNALAIDTGGFVVRNENNFGRALDAIQRDAGTYYVLGYTPANQTLDGKYREIRVTVKRPDVKVRARRGYLALEPAKMLRPQPITAPHAVPENAEAGSVGAEAPTHREATTPVRAEAPTHGEVTTSVGAEAPTHAEATSAAATKAAAALRSHIDAGGIVQELRTAEHAVAGDAAGKGWEAYQRGDVENASVFLRQAAASPDAHAWVSYALGLSQLALGQYAEASTSWERVRQQAPDFPSVYYNLADAYLLQKKDDEALKVLRDAQQRFPKDEEACNAIGVIQIRRGALDSAIDAFAQATKIAPTEGLGFFNLGRAYQIKSRKSQRYDRKMQKWIGGEKDRDRAIANLEKYIKMGGPYVQQAQEALATLNWK